MGDIDYFAEVWKGDPIVDKVLARLAELEAALAERDEALTIAWRLCLQEAWGDLREHLDCTASVGPVARAEEGEVVQAQ